MGKRSWSKKPKKFVSRQSLRFKKMVKNRIKSVNNWIEARRNQHKIRYSLLISIIIGLSLLSFNVYTNNRAASQKLNSDHKSIIELSKQLKNVSEQKAGTDIELKKKADTEASLKAEIDKLTKDLQTKREKQRTLANRILNTFSLTGTVSAQANDYAWGNCTYFVASMFDNVPSGLGDAANWANGAKALGFIVSPVPKLYSVAQTSAGYYGHVAIVINIDLLSNQVQLKEMNVEGLNVISTRWVSLGDYQYIYF